MSPFSEIDQRLQRLRALWRELQHTSVKSPRYQELGKQIRVESDAYQALLDAQQQQQDKPSGVKTD